MPLLRTVVCDVCGAEYTEKSYGTGFPGWMSVHGIELDGNHEVWLCPIDMAVVANKIDSMKQENTE